MSYLLRNNKRDRKIRPILLRACISAVVLILIGTFVRQPLSKAASVLITPIIPIRSMEQSAEDYIKTLFFSKYTLSEQVHTLQDQNMQLQQQLATLEEEKRLSTEWQNTLLNASSSPFSRRLAPVRVIMRPPYSPFDTLLLEKGSGDGIVMGAKVYALGDLLPIGTVTTLSSNQSTVTLFSSADQKFVIRIGSSTEEWTSEGKGGGMFEARIPKAQTIVKGDPVFIPKESPIMYSIVSDVTAKESEPFQIVRFLVPVLFRDLDVVAVGTHI